MRNLKGREWEALEQNLGELLRQAIAVRRSLEKMSVDDFGTQQMKGDVQDLACFVSDTVGDVSERLETLNDILMGLQEHATN